MALFRVMVEAENLPSPSEPDSLMGFFTNRYCEAPNSGEAEAMVLRTVQDEYSDILSFAIATGLNPTVNIVECEHLEVYPDFAPATGATWFPMV